MVTVILKDELYVEEGSELRFELAGHIDRGYSKFLIDLSGVSYIDNARLGVLIPIQKKAQ